MNCENVRELLAAFIDDELPVEIVARINGHVADCLECQNEREALTIVRSHMHDYKKTLEPTSGFMERLKIEVEGRMRARQSAPRLRMSPYLVPIAAAAAAVVLYILPQHHEQQSSDRIASMAKTPVLTAQELYSYEHKIQKTHLVPVEYDSSLALKLTGVVAKAPHFQGWSLTRTSVVSVNSTKAIKYNYSQIDHGKVKTMVCYQFQGAVFDSSALSHHVIDGRSICCGTQQNVSLVSWKNTNITFVLASELPRADLLSIALDS